MNELDGQTKCLIAQQKFGKIIKQLSFFRKKDKMFIANVVNHFRPMHYQICEFIYQYGDFPAAVYFLIKGRVHFVIGPKHTVYKTMTTGSYFGEIEILAKIPRTTVTRAGMNVEVMTINKQAFEKIMKQYPFYANQIQERAIKRN